DRGYEPHTLERVGNAAGVFRSLAYKLNVDLPESPTVADVSKVYTEMSKRLSDTPEGYQQSSTELSRAYNTIRGNFDVFQMGATGKGWFTPPAPPAGEVPPGTAPGHRATPGPVGPRPFFAGTLRPIAPEASAAPAERPPILGTGLGSAAPSARELSATPAAAEAAPTRKVTMEDVHNAVRGLPPEIQAEAMRNLAEKYVIEPKGEATPVGAT